MSSSKGKIITVVGSGLIGRSWAMVFLSGGYRVKLYDNQPGQASRAIAEIRKQVEELQETQMLRGNLSASDQLSLLSSHDDLSQALEGAFFVQECVFEDLQAKQTVFQAVENHVGEDTVLSSSTSCLMPSNVFSLVQNPKRCIISHPVNPPYYVRLVELVPHPETMPSAMDRAFELMTEVGQAPVRLRKEIDGFALNRVQYAIIAECWRLVKDNVISVKDIDLVMSEGLGMRYAFIGPVETMHLNAPNGASCKHPSPSDNFELHFQLIFNEPLKKVITDLSSGLEDYLGRYREGMRRVLSSFGPIPEFDGEAATRINKEICELIPSDQEHLFARRERRDQLLMGLAKLKK